MRQTAGHGPPRNRIAQDLRPPAPDGAPAREAETIRSEAVREAESARELEATTEGTLRDAIDKSKHGAPSASEAVSDIFSTDEIFHRVMASALEESQRSTRLLFMSSLAAGLSIGLTFLARAGLTGLMPADATGLFGNLLYPIGFVFIILGRYQLFTENTLTPVTLVLKRLVSLPRLWSPFCWRSSFCLRQAVRRPWRKERLPPSKQ